MTKKRFKVTDGRDDIFSCDWSVTDYADGGIVHHPMTSENMANVMCNLLNELNDEKIQMEKEFNGELHNWGILYDEAKNKVDELSKENNELKEKIAALQMELTELKQSNVPECTGYLKKSIPTSQVDTILNGRWVNRKIEELRRLGYSDEYINKKLGHLVNWRI